MYKFLVEPQSSMIVGSDILDWKDVAYTSASYSDLLTWVQSKGFPLTNVGTSQEGDYDLYTIETGDQTKPCVMLIANQHGWERGGAHHGTEFLYRVKNKAFVNPIFNALSNDLCFILLISANPWGYERGERRNSRGVDINRNFDYNWTSTGEGTSAFSEAEAKIIRDLVLDKQPIAVVDIHTWSGYTWTSTIEAQSAPQINLMTEDIIQSLELSVERDWRRYHGNYSMATLPNWVSTLTNKHGEKTLSWLLETRHRWSDEPKTTNSSESKAFEAINYYACMSHYVSNWFKNRELIVTQ